MHITHIESPPGGHFASSRRRLSMLFRFLRAPHLRHFRTPLPFLRGARFYVAAAERTRSAMQVIAGAADVQARGVGRFVGLLVRRERIHIVPHELRHIRLTAFQQRAAAGLSRISHES